jgi:hypothetical protein
MPITVILSNDRHNVHTSTFVISEHSVMCCTSYQGLLDFEIQGDDFVAVMLYMRLYILGLHS